MLSPNTWDWLSPLGWIEWPFQPWTKQRWSDACWRPLAPASDTYAQADYGRIHQELGRKGVTLMLLWEEYCAQVGDEHSADNPVKPWRYSQFCENYRQFSKRLKRSMRQVHRAGEKLFIDFAGPTIALMVHGQEVGPANIFVAAMLGVALALQHFSHRGGAGHADAFAPGHQPLGRPLGLVLVALGQVLSHGGETAFVGTAHVAGNTVATVQGLYRMGGNSQLQRQANQGVGHAVAVALEFDVAVDVHAHGFEDRPFPGLHRQGHPSGPGRRFAQTRWRDFLAAFKRHAG